VSQESRAYPRLVAAALFAFLLLSDWVLLGGPLLVVRRALVAAVALIAVPYAIRNRRAVANTVIASPLVHFAAFLAAGLLLSPFALAPGHAAFHTLVFAGVLLFAVAVAGTVSLATTLSVIRVTLALKLVGSLIVGLFGSQLASTGIFGLASSSLLDRHRFGGLFGNANPLCEAAAAYLLLTACHFIERGRKWPSGWRGRAQAAWYGFTLPLAAYLMWQSVSRSAWIGLALVALLLGVLTQWRRSPDGTSRRRRVVLLTGAALILVIAIPLLLVWLNASRGIVRPAAAPVESVWKHVTSGAILHSAKRPVFWAFALEKIRQRPWTGYGMSSTPMIYAGLFPKSMHAHNLELEAALYAGIPAALLILAFVVTSLRAAARALLARRPVALSVAALLFFFVLLSQVETLILGSPYPSLPIVLILAAHLGRRLGSNTTGLGNDQAGEHPTLHDSAADGLGGLPARHERRTRRDVARN
jgi:O-antigen ligase